MLLKSRWVISLLIVLSNALDVHFVLNKAVEHYKQSLIIEDASQIDDVYDKSSNDTNSTEVVKDLGISKLVSASCLNLFESLEDFNQH